jgi:N-formylglutamate amidohydrolase
MAAVWMMTFVTVTYTRCMPVHKVHAVQISSNRCAYMHIALIHCLRHEKVTDYHEARLRLLEAAITVGHNSFRCMYVLSGVQSCC